VRTHEHVSQNEERTCWRWNIHAQEGEQALATTCRQGIVRLCECVLLATDNEVDVWSVCVAINCILLVERWNGGQLLSTNLCRELGEVCSRNCHKRGARIHNRFPSGGVRLATDLHVIHGNSPIAEFAWSSLDHWRV